MAPSRVHSCSVGNPKRVPVRVRVSYSFTVRVRVEFRHSELEPQRNRKAVVQTILF